MLLDFFFKQIKSLVEFSWQCYKPDRFFPPSFFSFPFGRPIDERRLQTPHAPISGWVAVTQCSAIQSPFSLSCMLMNPSHTSPRWRHAWNCRAQHTANVNSRTGGTLMIFLFRYVVTPDLIAVDPYLINSKSYAQNWKRDCLKSFLTNMFIYNILNVLTLKLHMVHWIPRGKSLWQAGGNCKVTSEASPPLLILHWRSPMCDCLNMWLKRHGCHYRNATDLPKNIVKIKTL